MRSEHRNGSLPRFLAPLLVLLLLAGCGGGGPHWYNPGKSQVDFAGDSQECEIVAGEFARQATINGRREEPRTYGRAFDDCLAAKGWGGLLAMPPPSDATIAEAEPPLAVYHPDGTIEAFGRSHTVPAGFILQADSVQSFGPARSQQLLFRGPDETFMNITVQKSPDRKFEPINYPAQEPFFLYEQGRDEKKPNRLRWAIFAGQIQEEWVVGLGGYLLLGDRERLTVVITSPLADPHSPVPAGLTLSRGQFQAVEGFRQEWLFWLQEQM